MASVLVAYATVYGSTREVAEAVAEALRERGAEVDVQPAGDVRSLEGYSAVVLGGALYYFRWHKDARKFLSRHHTALEALPVAVFGLGPFNNDTEELADARKPLDKLVTKESWLSPVAVEVFVGAFDPQKLRFPHNVPAMKKMPPSDNRDWDAIRAWANELPEKLGLR